MAATLNKLTPNRDLQCYFFEPSAIAALSQTSETGFTVSGTWRQQFDWAVIEWNRDNVFEYPALRNLPDGNLSGITLSYEEARTNCIAIDSTWYATVDWPSLRIWADDSSGNETIYYVPLLNYATPAAGSYTQATAQFELTGTVTPQDYIELAWLDQHFNYQIQAGDSLETAISSLSAAINDGQATGGVTAVANGTQITLTYIGTPGANGNRIGVYGTVHGQGTESWSPASVLFSGGVSPSQWQIALDFSNLHDVNNNLVPTTNVRKMRWTWAADIQASAFTRTEFSAVVTNWTVTGSNIAYSVAGPGSWRVEDNDASLTYYQPNPLPSGTTGWTLQLGNYSGGTASVTTAPTSSVSLTYSAPWAHTLYLGTRRTDGCAAISAVVDGGTAQSFALALSGEDEMVRISLGNLAAGSHTVTVTHVGNDGDAFWFDFFEIAVPTTTLPTFPAVSKVTLATDWDTDAVEFGLPPERVAWIINQLGFQGRANHYAGALWFYELVDSGAVNATVTVQFAGTPTFSQYTDVVFGTGTTATTIQHQNLIGDTAETIALCFALLINQGSTAAWAQANGAELTITARATGAQGNGLAISVATNSTQFTAQTSGPELAGGADAPPEGPDSVIWRTDLTATPPINRAARDWSLSFLSALKSYGIDVAVSFSMELGNGDDSAATGIAQCYPDGPVWVSTPALQTNFSPASTAFWQQVYLEMANLMAQAGLVPYLQFGEVQWWYFADAAGMPFYDAYTTSAFQAQYGSPMAVIPSQNSSPASFPQESAFLPTLIGQFTQTIMSFVRQSQPNTRFEVLYPTDTNDTPLDQVINYPTATWTPANLTCLKTENLSYTQARDMNLISASISFPQTLGFPSSQTSHLIGISDCTTPWVKEENLSVGQGLESVVLFALDQFCLIGYSLPLGNGTAWVSYMGR